MSKKYPITIFTLTFIIFWIKDIFDFISTSNLAGLDLIGNYSLVWLMHNFLSSFSITGWTNLWFCGMPVFVFYPPLFFIVSSVLSYVSFGLLSILMSYKILIISCLLFLPLIMYYCSKNMGFNELESFFISLWILSYLFIHGIFSGINQTLNFGLITQMFGLNLLGVFMGELFRIHDFFNMRRTFTLGVLMGLVILSHVFIGIISFICLFVFLVLNFGKNVVKAVIIIGLIAFSFSSPWWMSMLFNVTFLETYGWNPMKLSQFSLVLMFFSLFVFLNFKTQNKFFLTMLFLIVLYMGVMGLPFELQYDRFFAYSFFFGSILAGIGSYTLYEFVSKKITKTHVRNAILIVLIIVPIILILTAHVEKGWKSKLEIDELMSYIKENLGEGRILIESDKKLGNDYRTLMERIPIETGKPVLNQLHIDSVSGPYTLALQSYVSSHPKQNPICKMCGSIISESKELILEQMEKFNVKYVISTNKKSKNFLDDFLIFKENIGEFYVFEVPIDETYYEIPQYKPIIVISDFKGSEYSWKKLSELVFVDKNLQNLTFVWSPTMDVNYENFGAVIKLKDVRIRGNISVYEPTEGERMEDFMNRIKGELFIKNEVKAAVENFNFNNEKIQFKVKSKDEVPILLKFSYFPNWDSSKKIYLANPSLMLVYAKGDVALEYEKNRYEMIGLTVSIILIIAFIFN